MTTTPPPTRYTPAQSCPALAAGTYPARCSALIDLGTHADRPPAHSSFPAQPGRQRRFVLLTFTLTLPDGRTQRLSRQFPVSCDVRSSLSKFLTPWLGNIWFRGDRKAAQLIPLRLTDQPCLLTLVESEAINPRTGQPWINIASACAPIAGLQVPDLRWPPTLFTLRQPDRDTFRRLPAWIAAKIRQSTEWHTLTQNRA